MLYYEISLQFKIIAFYFNTFKNAIIPVMAKLNFQHHYAIL